MIMQKPFPKWTITIVTAKKYSRYGIRTRGHQLKRLALYLSELTG